jgi:hypothetical protein
MSAVRAFCMAIGRVPVHIFVFDLIARESTAFNRDDFIEPFYQFGCRFAGIPSKRSILYLNPRQFPKSACRLAGLTGASLTALLVTSWTCKARRDRAVCTKEKRIRRSINC